MSIRITCINKEEGHHLDPHAAIISLGWVEDGTGKSGKWAREKVYNWIKNERGVAYVLDQRGNKAYLYGRENIYGTKFVQTYADQVWTDNLLSLPECA